jgi:hypothetical protein
MIEMRRPNWDAHIASFSKGAYYICTCATVVQSLNDLREHWQAGHLDYAYDIAYVLSKLEAKIDKEILEHTGWPEGPDSWFTYDAGLQFAKKLIKDAKEFL